jgi:hypothetical protein
MQSQDPAAPDATSNRIDRYASASRISGREDAVPVAGELSELVHVSSPKAQHISAQKQAESA